MIKNPRWAHLWLISAALLSCQAKPGTGTGFREYSGLVEFDERVLSFELGGRLRERSAERGQAVASGALLASLDRGLDEAVLSAQRGQVEAASAQVAALESGPKGEDIRAQSERVEAAKSQETLARESFERDSRLVESGALPSAILSERRAQLERATAERKSLEAQLASLRRGARKEDVSAAKAQAEAVRAGLTLTDEKLKRHELKAPTQGTILEVHAEVGEVVAPLSPIVTLADLDHPLVEVFVPQNRLSSIRIGTSARVRTDALEAPLVGRVDYISPRTEFTPRYVFSDPERARFMVRVRVRVDDPEHRMFAGVPAFVAFEGKP